MNTHRILVRGTRIENLPEEIIIQSEASRVPVYLVIPAVGVPMMFVVLAVMLFISSRRPKKTGEQLLEEFRKR